MVIQPQFPSAPAFSDRFSEGLAAVSEFVLKDPGAGLSSENTGRVLRGYVDMKGKMVIQPKFDWVTSFSQGLAAVGVTDGGVATWGYIDTEGAWVVRPQFAGAGPFSEGVALVVSLPADGQSGQLPPAQWRCSYIDPKGKVVISLQQGYLGHDFAGGVAAARGYQAPAWPFL